MFKSIVLEVKVAVYSVIVDDFDVIFVQLLSTFGG